MDDAGISAIILVVLLVGLAGTLLPILPGILLMLGAVIVYGVIVGFGAIGIAVVAACVALSLLAVALGIVLPQRAAEESGASRRSQFAAAGGAIIGFFVIPVIGAIVGALLGIALSEYLITSDWDATKRSTIGIAKGFGLSTLAQFVIGFVILLLWLVWAAVHVL